MRYFFRSPVYPVLFKVGRGAVCAATPKELDAYLRHNAAGLPDECGLIDYRWEGWTLYPKDAIVSPMALKKRYTKREFLIFCGISEEQLAITNVNKYSREEIFDYVLHAAQAKD
ncbi:MAG: hypothetical protein FJ395_17445 [Verrucomicrobia bacterium]|nr:hypothetical protein [Verrucomicrobiota bacterium]